MGFDKQAMVVYGDDAQVARVVRDAEIVPSLASEDAQWSVDQLIERWLKAKSDKSRSRSGRTEATYRAGITAYREKVLARGRDLDCCQSAEDLARLSGVAEDFAGKRRADGRKVSANLYNQRLAILSSFYIYALRKGDLKGDNPIARLDRSKVEPYAQAQPIPADEIAARLAMIDRRSPRGQRDYALLAVAVYTGRRLSELAAMRRRDLTITGDSVTAVVFPSAKGGKVVRNILDDDTGGALLVWLRAFYGETAPETMAADAPVWVSLARNYRHDSDGRYGGQLSIQAIADICHRWLGVSKVHALRHSFAHEMEALGAKVSEIQAALGHASIATTGIYLSAMHNGENPHGKKLAKRFGIRATPGATTRPLGKR